MAEHTTIRSTEHAAVLAALVAIKLTAEHAALFSAIDATFNCSIGAAITSALIASLPSAIHGSNEATLGTTNLHRGSADARTLGSTLSVTVSFPNERTDVRIGESYSKTERCAIRVAVRGPDLESHVRDR